MKKLGTVLLAIVLLCSFSLTALAVEFTPSVEQKPGPTIIEQTDDEGEPYIAVIEDEDGNKSYISDTTDLNLVVTPLSEKDNAVVIDITEQLDSAIRQIDSAENVGSLTPTMVDALEALKAASNDPAIKELNINDLVICDLFDVSLVRDGVKLEELAPGETVTFAIQTNFTNEDVFFLLCNVMGVEWELIDSYSLASDGTLYITLKALGPLAIVVDNMRVKPVNPDGPTSPQTGDTTESTFLMGAAVFGIASVFFAARAFSSRKKQEQ